MRKIVLLMALFSFFQLDAREKRTVDTRPISSFDLNRYLGTWYEIARYDHRFERGLVGCTAEYRLKPDGTIQVVNTGYKETLQGKKKVSEGKARQPNPKLPAHLEVSFFLWFYQPYNILYLDEEYRYVLVGSDSDKYLWILSRTPKLPDGAQQILLAEARRRGFDTNLLIWVEQSKND